MMGISYMYEVECDNAQCKKSVVNSMYQTQDALKTHLRKRGWRFLYDQDQKESFVLCDVCTDQMGIGYPPKD